ncbi:hypothetical protein LMG19282_01487 [Cupriavidus campinensis]|uniref:Uncharacterized protein n=1 Tax=Cupriavidus campinensis TaxID=151783 RepID=A0ABY3EJ61_9BURK|nr:hypothetical protein [Cupriavidus campinensis]TSP10987.1 hypothetical protein FGG12_19175 [Cupriavidus campinensis]CAG2138377.1 hypothetical protein LMG19282_01487 [Cupriavidus campinensis]
MTAKKSAPATKTKATGSKAQQAVAPKRGSSPASKSPARALPKKAAAVPARKGAVAKVPAKTPQVTKAAPKPGKSAEVNAPEPTKPSLSATAVEARPRNEHGRRIGRPKTRLEELRAVPTRCPSQIYTYLKGITPFLYNSLTAMFEDMLRRFLAERPWEHGLHWRKPKTAMSYAGGQAGKTGWEQVNIQLPQDLAELVGETATVCGVSRACLCYTAIFWWVQFIYPPAKMLGSKSDR